MDEISNAMFTTAHQLAEQSPHALHRMERSRDVGEMTGSAIFVETSVTRNVEE